MEKRPFFNNPWILPIGVSLVLWALIPFSRELTEVLRDRNLLRLVLIAGSGVFIGAAGWAWRGRWRALSVKRRVLFLLTLAVYIFVILRTGVMPEERTHFLQVSFLSVLYWRAMLREGWSAGRAALYAALAGGLVGVIEETLQLAIPTRQFDWRDIGMNLLAAGFSGVLLWRINPGGCAIWRASEGFPDRARSK